MAERGAAALQAVSFCAGRLQGAGLVGVAVTVLAAAGDGLFLLRAIDLVVVRLDAGVGISVGLHGGDGVMLAAEAAEQVGAMGAT